MTTRDTFVSVVLSVRNVEGLIGPFIDRLAGVLQAAFDYYEIVIVDDASDDATRAEIEGRQATHKNIQLYGLPRSRGGAIALTAGLDHAIGDFTIVLDVRQDPPDLIPELVAAAAEGADIVYALPRERASGHGLYNTAVRFFLWFLARMNDVDIPLAMSSYRLFSRSVLNYMLESTDRHRTLAIAPALSGYDYATVDYDREPRASSAAGGGPALRREALYKALNLMFSTSVKPLRIVTVMSLGISVLAFFYAFYVILTVVFMSDVAAGWASISLQVSGLFFLVCIILAVMSEYLLQVLETTGRRPLYHIAKQSHSARMDYEQDLNVVREERDTQRLDHRADGLSRPGQAGQAVADQAVGDGQKIEPGEA